MIEAAHSGRRINVVEAIETAPLGRFVSRVVVLCACIALLDGFDTLAISYVAPAIAESWALSKEAFGPIFAAHYVGAATGAAVFGIFADHAGRKPAIMISTAVFAVFALLTPLTAGWLSLFAIRAATGVGLGGALSNVIGLVAEYAPKERRATLVSVMYAAFPLGGVLGGPLAAWLVQHESWQSVFVVGGALPLVLIIFLALGLPESLRFIVASKGKVSKVASIMKKIRPSSAFSPGDLFVIEEIQSVTGGDNSSDTILRPYLRPTIFLCAASFLTQLVIVFVITWMPTLLRANGLPLARAIIASATFSLGGIVGSLLLSRIIDKRGDYGILVGGFLISAAVIACIGYAATNWPTLLLVVFGAGVTIVGVQVNLSAYSATVYPTHIRSTGIGWIISLGRVGAIAGALVGTAFVSAGLSIETQYMAAATPAILAAGALAHLRRGSVRGSVIA
jgi:AAHS family 4-hydroxybenzoate transporter-like MFS transporter